MSNKFEILMQQLDMPLAWRQSAAFLHAEIEGVIVHKLSKVWEFRFVFDDILPIEAFRELRDRLRQEFVKTGNQAVFQIRTRETRLAVQELPAYYQEAFLGGSCASQGFRTMFQNLPIRLEGNALLIEGTASLDTEHFRKNHLPNLVKELENFGFPRLTVELRVDEALSQQQVAAFEAEREKIVQVANEETLQVLASLEQQTPPPAVEEKPVFGEFSAKKALAKPKLDKA